MADHDEEDEQTVAKDIVVTKYKMAGDMINGIIKEVLLKCVAGAKVIDICEFGDARLNEETSKVFKKEKEMKKGIAFPTCVSINNCVCHFSPLKSEPDVLLSDGDVVKVDMGAHIDGFVAVVAHTVVVGASSSSPVTGRKADAILAAYYAAEAALRLVKPGNENNTVTEAIQKIAEDFNCKPVEGMLSHQLQQHVIDGEKAIILNPNETQKKEHAKCEFDVHEVYAVDILISTGDGKGREMDTRTTVHKKKEVIYQLKMKASRQFLSEVEKKFNTMPFSLRAFEDEKKAKLGVVECVKHHVVDAFPVYYEREGEFVAQFKYTLLLMPNGPMRITGHPFELSNFVSEHSVKSDDMKQLLSSSANPKVNKKKKKKAEKAVLGDASVEPVEA